MSTLRLAGAAAATVVVLAASACTSSDEPSPSPGPSGATTPAGLVADDGTAAGNGIAVSGCSPKSGRATRQTRYEPTATAHGDLTVTGIQVVGTDVSVADAEGVLVTRPDHDGRALISPTWPVNARDLPDWADQGTRASLDGLHLADGDQLLPMVRLEIDRAGGQAAMTALRLTYRTDGGSEKVDLPMAVTFPDGKCPRPGAV